jgi:NitT/TauT family transport system substrate-binding protein
VCWGRTFHYSFTLSGAADEVSAAVFSGAVDIAAVHINLAAVLSAKTGNGSCCRQYPGRPYILEMGDSIRRIGDLAAEKLLATARPPRRSTSS